MKATGIIRSVDDLGRVVIPKEIRKSLGIKEGDEMEVFISGEEEDTVCFKKHGKNINWERARRLVSCLIRGFFIFDDRGEPTSKMKFDSSLEDLKELPGNRVYGIRDNEERVLAYLVVNANANSEVQIEEAVMILKTYLEWR